MFINIIVIMPPMLELSDLKSQNSSNEELFINNRRTSSHSNRSKS
ncbi:MAG: hypothetical protein ACR5KW_00175 [Wolbachia sp.]